MVNREQEIQPAAKPSRANRLLAALSPARYRQLEPGLEQVELPFGKILYEPGTAPSHIYFPNDSLISLLVVIDGDGLEVGLVGREGMVGVGVALGHEKSQVQALVQGGGSAMRMSTERFRKELKRDGGLRREVDRCVYMSLGIAMQIAACNKTHLLGRRLARWLMMVRDRRGRDDFPLTQDFMARMLGVRRAGVTEAASALQRRNLIDYRRGRVKLLDVEGVRATACSCYEVIRKLENAE